MSDRTAWHREWAAEIDDAIESGNLVCRPLLKPFRKKRRNIIAAKLAALEGDPPNAIEILRMPKEQRKKAIRESAEAMKDVEVELFDSFDDSPPEGLEDAVRKCADEIIEFFVDVRQTHGFQSEVAYIIHRAVQPFCSFSLQASANSFMKHNRQLQADNDALEKHISELSRDLLHASYHIEAVTCSTTTDKDVEKARKFMRKIDGDIMISVPKEGPR